MRNLPYSSLNKSLIPPLRHLQGAVPPTSYSTQQQQLARIPLIQAAESIAAIFIVHLLIK
jgi:hypothetical protein